MMTPDRDLRRARNARRGVTLLEVIVSMAVLLVGLMGMASLIPLGRLEMAEGDRLDNTSTLGRGAFRELSVHGYLNPQMWAHPLTGGKVADRFNYVFNGADVLPPIGPLVIDPLMCAPRFQNEGVNAAGAGGADGAHRNNVQYFPYSAVLQGKQANWPEGSIPKLARATLRTYPIDASRTLASSLAHTMRFDVASRYFRSSDDLLLKMKLDKTRRPVQVFAQSAVTDLKVTAHDGVVEENEQEQIAYRKYSGDYSWFFLVEPNPAERWSADDTDMPFSAGWTGSPCATNGYRVWVIVCNKRDLRDTGDMNLDRDRVVGERCVWVDFVDRYTARLRVLGVADEGTASRILDVKPNQWIAAGTFFENNLLPGGKQYMLEWYRILSAADRPSRIADTDDWYREVALSGRDMSSNDSSGLRLISPQSNVNYADVGQPSHIAWGIIIPGVRGVFEKSIYLDRPSMWSPQ